MTWSALQVNSGCTLAWPRGRSRPWPGTPPPTPRSPPPAA